MKRTSMVRIGRRGGIASCLVMTACAVPPTAPAVPEASTGSRPALHLAQLGHGRLAVFGWCLGDDCPQRSPKTLASASTPTIAATLTPMRPLAPADDIAKSEESAGLAPRPSRSLQQEASQSLSVHFHLASARLDSAAREALRRIAPQLRQATEVRVSGRTDGTGPASANDLLAKERAEAVRRELLALVPGIAPIVTVDAQGACCFVDTNDSAAGRARNRRVDIFYRLHVRGPP